MRKIIFVLMIVIAPLVSAAPITWQLSDAVFSDGGTVTGSFVYDADTDKVSSWSISVAGGDTVSFPPKTYSSSNQFNIEIHQNGPTPISTNPVVYFAFIRLDTPAGNIIFCAPDTQLLTDNGGTVSLLGARCVSQENNFEVVNSRTVNQGELIAISETPFATFGVKKLKIDQYKESFSLKSGFAIGKGSDGISPVTEEVTLKIGTFTTTIPAGSFKKDNKDHQESFTFKGVISGVNIDAIIKSQSKNPLYTFDIDAQDTGLKRIQNPVTVELDIGNDSGITSINAIFKKMMTTGGEGRGH